ncbi:MAG: SGNH/GDSL hydrolase family protein, partial [Candidatus Omnitrophica bacterium]|nr:SGNH/GDSL hydrolase family protein [Candidatus Omnitrophota bacterium]
EVKVYNAGVSGYSPIHYYMFYRHILSVLKPDLIIIQLFGNDPFGDYKVASMSLLDDKHRPIRISRYFRLNTLRSECAFFCQSMDWLQRHSKFGQYLTVWQMQLLKKSAYHQEKVRQPFLRDGTEWILFQKGPLTAQQEKFNYKTWECFTHNLLELKKLLALDHVKFMVFNLPLASQIKTHRISVNDQYYFRDGVSNRYNDQLKAFMEKEGMPFIDFLDVFNDLKVENVFFHYDGHLNSFGHKIVAEKLGADPNFKSFVDQYN